MRLLSSLWSLFRVTRPRLGPDYHHFRKIIIPTPRGTTEIDHLIVSRFGVFVIELKDRSGWIFGDQDDAYWTAVHFQQKFRFQNPLRQNFGHAKAIEDFLGISPHALHSVVVFRGSFEFKTPIPSGVRCHEYLSWVAEKRDVLLEQPTVDAILASLQSHAQHGWLAGRRHARAVRERYADDTTCPKCDGELVLRTAQKGPEPGSRFLGCSNYPACRYKRNMHAS